MDHGSDVAAKKQTEDFGALEAHHEAWTSSRGGARAGSGGWGLRVQVPKYTWYLTQPTNTILNVETLNTQYRRPQHPTFGMGTLDP